MDKKQARLRRARQTRLKIRELTVNRLTVFRTNMHIYANIVDATGGKVLASASTVEPEVRSQLQGTAGKGGNAGAAAVVGKRIAERALAAGIDSVAFDRAGYRFHGRVKALAEAAREAGLKF
jgi:large subunit ribosomal protein L18